MTLTIPTTILRKQRLRPLFATLISLLFTSTLSSAQSTGPQQLAFAGLRSVANQGQFNAVKTDAMGNLYLLLDQKDGVRILKTDPTATTVLAQSQLGAAGDIGLSLSLDPAGNVYVAGTSASTSLTGTAGAAFPNRADTSINSFVAKYDANLNNLFVTFAGSGRLAASSVAATADAVFVTGSLFAATLPVTPGAYQQTPATGSSQHGFVERFSADGKTLVYATYVTGANGNTSPATLVADSSDHAYVAGSTSAPGFPTLAALAPVIQSAPDGSAPSSGFLTKLSPAGDALSFSTFIPGSGVTSLALDSTASTLLLSGSVALGAFPVANVTTPLVATTYQVLERLPLDGSSVLSSTLLAPGPQSYVTSAPNGTAWVNGTLVAPLLPLSPFANTGNAFAARVTAQGMVDQTSRFGGLASTNQANASAPIIFTSLAVDLTGQPVFAGAFSPTTSSSLLATQRYDLSLTQPSSPLLPSAVGEAAVPPGGCPDGSQCAGSAAYLAKLDAGIDAPSLALSTGASPDILLRNLGSAQATGLQLTASGFTVSSNCGQTLDAGGECSVALTGAGPGTLTVQAANATSRTATLPASNGSPTPVVFSPRELDFGVQTLTSAPILRTITVTNLSQQGQTFTSAIEALNTPRGTTPPFTEASSDCPTGSLATNKVLAAGATCHITLALALSGSIPDGPIQNLWKVAVAGAHDVLLTAYANAAALSTSASQIDFGTQYPGGLRTSRFLYLSNNSDASIQHTPVSIALPFAATDRCPTTLVPHSVCQIQFAYESAASPSNDAVTLSLDQGLTVVVSGHAMPAPGALGPFTNPNLTVNPSSISFPDAVPVATQSNATQTVTIANNGVNPFSLSLALTGDFTQSTNCPPTLPGQQNCAIVLSFAPAAPGSRSGVLSITAGGGTPVYVNLSGTATAILPQNNGTLDFGSLYVTEPTVRWFKVSQPFQSLTAATTGPFKALLVEDIGYGPGNPAPAAFQQTYTGPCTNCYLGIQFKPSTFGPQTGTLALTSGSATNAYNLALTGSGLSISGLVATPATQDFGTVPVHSTSQAFLLSLTNLLPSNTSVTLTSPMVTGDFAISQAPTGGAPCTGTLAPAATCFTQAIFSPTAVGARTGTVTFQSSAGPITVAVSGLATGDPGLALSPNAVTFQNVPSASATQQSISITNTGTSTLQVGTPSVLGSSFTSATTCGILVPTTTCTLNVTFTPTTAQTTGTLQLPVTVVGQQTSTTYTVPLTGAYTSVNAALQILPAQTNFGPTLVDGPGPTRTFTLNNLTAQSLTVNLNLPRQFALTAANPCPTLAANDSCSFNVSSLPLTAGDTTGSLTVQATPSGGTGPTGNVIAYLESYATTTNSSALRITGNLSPGTGVFDFGQVASGQSLSQTLTITNTSATQPLTMRRITTQPPFLSTTTCTVPLGPSQTCVVTVTYSPINQVAAGTTSTAITNTGTLTIESDDPISPTAINLNGAAGPTAVSTPSNAFPIAAYILTQGASTIPQGSLTFPNTAVGNISALQTVTLLNTGTVVLHPSAFRIASDFSLTNNCPSAVLPGSSCTLSLAFTPVATGTRTGTLQIATDSAGSLDFLTLYGVSSPSSLLLSPQSVDFGSILVGASATQPIQVTNNGQAAVTLAGVASTGDYTTNNNCPASLAVSSTCTIQATFTPTAAGTRTGTISVTNSASTLPLTVSLTGSGLQSRLQATATTLTFGSTGVGSSLNLTLTLANNGTAPVSSLALSITGDYTIATPCPTATLAPNQTCQITLTFAPSTIGPRTGALTITSTDPTSPLTISLSGNGTQSRLQLSPTTLAFGAVSVGSSATLAITLTNGGTATITGLTPSIVGDYAIATPCTATTLAPNQTCILQIRFTPTAASLRNGTLTVASSDPSSPATVALTGTGATTPPRLQVSPTALSFGSLSVNSTTSLSLTLSNTGTTAITNLATTITGDYAVTTPCPGTLPAAQSCTITVAFTPTTANLRTGVLTVTSSDPSSPISIPLSGTGTTPPPTPRVLITPSALVFTTTTLGSSTSLTLSVTNAGTATVTSLAFVITGDYGVATSCSTTLAVGQSCSAAITFTPTASGTRTGALTVTSSDPASPTTIPLTGSGTAPPSSPGSFTLTVNGASTATATIPSGSTATYTLMVTPTSGFTGPVVLNCTPLTASTYSSCAMLPSTLTLAGAPGSAILTITTLTSLASPTPARSSVIYSRALLGLLAPTCLVFFRRKRTRRSLPLFFAWTLLYGFALSVTGCGGGPDLTLRYVNPGTYLYQVTASSTATAPITQSVTVTVVITNN